MVNPDGVEYDIATGAYRMWRKNRQPNSGSSVGRHRPQPQLGVPVGLLRRLVGHAQLGDLPRSRRPSRRPRRRVRDFVNSRVVGGVQQIKARIDWHTYSELILWPYGYTTANTTSNADRETTATPTPTLGQQMAATNDYTPEQASDLYIADGTINDWMWATHKIFSYTFEMYPTDSNPGFYPPDEASAPQTSRNRAAVLMFLEDADCVYAGDRPDLRRARRPTVYFDDFETSTRLDARTPRAPTPPPPGSGSAATRRRPPAAAPSSSAPP